MSIRRNGADKYAQAMFYYWLKSSISIVPIRYWFFEHKLMKEKMRPTKHSEAAMLSKTEASKQASRIAREHFTMWLDTAA